MVAFYKLYSYCADLELRCAMDEFFLTTTQELRMKTAVNHSHDSAQCDDTFEAESDFISCSIKMLPEDQRVAAAETAVRINPANQAKTHQSARATDTVSPPADLGLLVSK